MARMLRRLTVIATAAGAARQYAKWAAQAGHFLDKSTKGKYHDRITSAVNKVRSSITS
jgi:hypothetical protein